MVLRFERLPVPRPMLEGIFGFERDIDELFENFPSSARKSITRDFPALEVSDQGDELVVLAEMPGVEKEDISLSVHKGVLTIGGTRKEKVLPENSSWRRNEIPKGRFTRSIQLPYEVDGKGVTAELQNGILKVVLPKAEEACPREISIR